MDSEELMAAEHTDHFTPADRREIIETGVNLKNLVNQFEELKKTLSTRETEAKEDSERMDERVRALENFRWWILGASAGCGALFGLLGSRFFHP